MDASKKILMERSGPIAKITFHDPDTLNALTPGFLKEFGQILGAFSGDETVGVVILTGTGKAFVAGADIAYMKDMSPGQADVYARDTAELYRAMETMDQVFIAAVNGYALGGGCELAMACDLRVASTKAKFGLPEVSLGILPGGGGTQRLPRLIGETRAKELIFTGAVIDAKRAQDIGLVNCLTEPERLLDEAMALAGRILKNSMDAVSLAKRAVNYGRQTGLGAALLQEQSLFSLCFGSEDQEEGMAAFLAKRPAVFRQEAGRAQEM